MVKANEIGTVHYSKILEANVTIIDGPTDDYYKIIGLECVLETSTPQASNKHKEKMTFPKIEKDVDTNN